MPLGVECLTDMGAVFETDHRGHTAMPHHRHEAAFAAIVLEGSYVEVRDDVPKVCVRGTIILHDAVEEHADRFLRDTRCLNVELPRGARPPTARSAHDETPLRKAAGDVVTSFYKHPDDLTATVRRLWAFFLDPDSEEPGREPSWLRPVIETFPWTQAVPLRNAAGIAGLHEAHFSRAFRRHMGMTAIEYRAQERIALASRLLLTTTTSLTQVALNCGFSDQSHLTRAFSERLGLAPADYRRTFAR